MIEQGLQAYLAHDGALEPIVVIGEIVTPRHPYLDDYPSRSRQVAISRGQPTHVEVVRFDELRFGDVH